MNNSTIKDNKYTVKTILTISDNQSISSIQEKFNKAFPYLKVEFFKHSHGIYQANGKSDILNQRLLIKQVVKKHVRGEIEVNDMMKVSELESIFQKQFGLSAQVFRKSAGTWIETSITDDWTLKQQNDEGKELSDFINNI